MSNKELVGGWTLFIGELVAIGFLMALALRYLR